MIVNYKNICSDLESGIITVRSPEPTKQSAVHFDETTNPIPSTLSQARVNKRQRSSYLKKIL